MSLTFTGRKRIRKSFGRIAEVAAMPNLIEVQKSSYDKFLQADIPEADRGDNGMNGVFQSVFPIKDFAETAELHYVKFNLEDPKYDVEECQQRGMTYAAPLKVTLRLIVFEVDEDTQAKSVLDIKEQEVYMGEMPLMTNNGTFVVNGTERVIVSQMHRSPGVFFDHDKGKTHSSGKFLFAARIIPYRGSWLDFEFDAKDIVFVRIDRRRKLPVTTLLQGIGLSAEEILNYFYRTVDYKYDNRKKGWRTVFEPERLRGLRAVRDLINAKNGDVIVEAGEKITPRRTRKLIEDGVKELLVTDEDLVGRYVAIDLIDESTGLVLAEAASFALAAHMPRSDAQALVQEACREAASGGHLIEILRERTSAPVDWPLLADPAKALGATDALIDRILAKMGEQRSLPETPCRPSGPTTWAVCYGRKS